MSIKTTYYVKQILTLAPGGPTWGIYERLQVPAGHEALSRCVAMCYTEADARRIVAALDQVNQEERP